MSATGDSRSAASWTAPTIDRRDVEKIMGEFTNLAKYYLPRAWDISAENSRGGAGIAMANIFAGILENVIVRLNKLPERNFIEFLNKLGVILFPAIAAKTPVTIALSPNVTQDVLIPQYTKLATSATSAGDSMTFETEDDMLVTPSTIKEIFSTDNTNDAIYRHTQDIADKQRFGLFGGSTTRGRISANIQEHILYVGHPELLNIKSCAVVITLLISTENTDDLQKIFSEAYSSGNNRGTWEYNWDADPPSTLCVLPSPYTRVINGKCYIALQKNDENEIKELQVNGIKSRWIRYKLASLDGIPLATRINNLEIQVHSIPPSELKRQNAASISNLSPSSTTDLTPDALAYNQIPLNVDNISSNPVLPFGMKPQALDSFYIASQDAFSKIGSSIELSFDFIPPPPPPSPPPSPPPPQSDVPIPTFNSPTAVLSWEYYNGTAWAGIDSVTTDGPGAHVNFDCPLDISPVRVAGIEDYWIKVVIASGNYGTVEMTSTPSSSGATTWSEDDSKILKPQLRSLPIITITPPLVPPIIKQCFAYNNLEYFNAIDTGANNIIPFQPFVAMEDAHPTVYLGFDNQVGKYVSGPLQVYVSLQEREFPKGVTPSMFDFNYYSDVAGLEKKIDVSKREDGTYNLTKTGNIKLYFPPDISSPSKFGNALYWIKVIDSTNTYAHNPQQKKTANTTIQPPEIKVISLNTVSAIQATTVKDEIIGGSSGEQNQTFTLTKIPISATPDNFKLWVNEGTYMSADEMAVLQIEKTEDPTGNLIAIWVLWTRVDNMDSSGPNDRNFTLDTTSGVIQFGDDIKGMVPPEGVQNIKATYLASDQTAGSVGLGELNSLKSNIPYVDFVGNPEPAQGGLDGEKTENALFRGPQILKNRGQAVTSEDFEWVVRQQFPILARVKCMPATNYQGLYQPGCVSIAIVQTSNEDQPIPPLGLLSNVQESLASCSSNVICSTAQLRTVPPHYIKVSVSADIYPLSMDLLPGIDVSVVRDTALDTLTSFFHPLLGGFDGHGWDFGYLVTEADIYQKLATIPEIDHANNVSIVFEDDKGVVKRTSVRPHWLMYSGTHNLSLKALGK
jgi:hypothetical protein